MGAIMDRLNLIVQRSQDLSALREPIRQRFVEGNREAVLSGKSPTGQAVAALRPSTLKRRKGTGPPRAPRRESSRVIANYVVTVQEGPGGLTFTGGWPGFPEIRYVDAARPTVGFRPEDVAWARERLREHVTEP